MKKIKIQPYELELLVFTSNESIEKYCKKKLYLIKNNSGEDIDLDTCKGLALVFKDNAIMVLLPEIYDEDTVDHELIHITWYVAHIIGQSITYDNNEFQTYLFTDLKKKIKKKVYKL